MDTHIETPGAFEDGYTDRVRDAILASPYLLENNLSPGFAGVRGFSIVFRRSALPQVAHDFPAFGPYLDHMLTPECNAFYLNALLLAATSKVGLHIDRSMYPYCETCGTPKYVSVLYVAVPAVMRGGVLIFRQGFTEVGRVLPELNKAVRFRGELAHQVTPVAAGTEGLRISLVCEQYALGDEQMGLVPELWVEVAGQPYPGA